MVSGVTQEHSRHSKLCFIANKNTWSVYFNDKPLQKPPRLNTENMAELAGLPAPRMDWQASNTPQALKKFKVVCEVYFSSPLKEKSEQEMISYLLIWSGD